MHCGILDPDTGKPLRHTMATANMYKIIALLEAAALAAAGAALRKILRAIAIYTKTLCETENHNMNSLIRARAGRDKGLRAKIRAIIGEAAISRWLRLDKDGWPPIDENERQRKKACTQNLDTPYVWKRYALAPLWLMKPLDMRLGLKPALPTSRTQPRGSRPYKPATFFPHQLEPDYEPTPEEGLPKWPPDPTVQHCHSGQALNDKEDGNDPLKKPP